MSIKTTVEFYALWADRTWTEESVELNGHYTVERAEELGRKKLGARWADNTNLVAIGPLYHIRIASDRTSDKSSEWPKTCGLCREIISQEEAVTPRPSYACPKCFHLL